MKSLKMYLVAAMLSSTAMLGWASVDAPKDNQPQANEKNSQAIVQHSPALPYGAHVVKTRFAVSFGFGGPYYYGPGPYYYDDDYYYGPYYRGYYYRHHHHWRHWRHHDWD